MIITNIARVDALLAAHPDTLTAPDMASRATWADAYRGAGHRETQAGTSSTSSWTTQT